MSSSNSITSLASPPLGEDVWCALHLPVWLLPEWSVFPLGSCMLCQSQYLAASKEKPHFQCSYLQGATTKSLFTIFHVVKCENGLWLMQFVVKIGSGGWRDCWMLFLTYPRWSKRTVACSKRPYFISLGRPGEASGPNTTFTHSDNFHSYLDTCKVNSWKLWKTWHVLRLKRDLHNEIVAYYTPKIYYGESPFPQIVCLLTSPDSERKNGTIIRLVV